VFQLELDQIAAQEDRSKITYQCGGESRRARNSRDPVKGDIKLLRSRTKFY